MLTKAVVLVILWVIPGTTTLQVTNAGVYGDMPACKHAWDQFRLEMAAKKMPLGNVAGTCIETPFLFEGSQT